jgi:hypothetical protein
MSRGPITPEVAMLWKKHRAISSSMVAFVELVKALQQKPRTKKELVELTGMANNTVLSILRLMRSRDLIYVKKYVRPSDRGSWAEAFMLGDEVDAPRPSPMTQRQYEERYKIKQQLARQGIRNVAHATEGE